jgi:hypothetical protein
MARPGTWAGAMACIARRQREDPDDRELLHRAREQLIQSWEEVLIVEGSQKLVESAGRYADPFARGPSTAFSWQQPRFFGTAPTNRSLRMF